MRTLILTLLVFSTLNSFAQPDNENKRVATDSLMKEYDRKIDSLARLIEATTAQFSSAAYDKSYKNSRIAVELLEVLDLTVTSMLADRNDAQRSSIIAQINSPSSNQLGFVFTDRLMAIAQDVINSTNIVDEQKARLKGSILNVIKGLANIFPPLNIATSVISTFASFQPPFVQTLEKKMRKGDSLIVRAVSPVTENMLQQFSTGVMPYINFYQNLNMVSVQFDNDLKSHRVRFSDYFPQISSLKGRYKDLNIDVNSTTASKEAALDILYEKNVNPKNTNFYTRISNKPEIAKLNGFTNEVLSLAREFRVFHDEYYRILIKHFEENLRVLDQAKALTGANATMIDTLVKQLQRLRNSTDANDPGFEYKFKKNLEKILSATSSIQ